MYITIEEVDGLLLVNKEPPFCEGCVVAKKRGSRILTTHALSCVDPDVHVLQIDLTFTDA
jgi:hypothetical protein